MPSYTDKQSRALKHQKAEKPKIGKGQPPANDGFEGENRIQMINGVPRLYYRTNNQWYFTGLSQDGAVPDVPIASPTQLGIIKIGSGGSIASDGTYTATAATPDANDIGEGDAAVTISTTTNTITIGPAENNADIHIKGTDGGAAITALTFDMSEAGAATFNNSVTIGSLLIMPDVTSTKILVADGTSFQEVALSGEATIASGGALTINDNAITNAKVADDAIDSDEIAAGAIDFAHMSVNSINSDQYVDGSIDVAHMSANSIDSAQYVDGSIDTAHIANDQITNALMADNAIDSAQLASGSVDDGHLSDGVATGLAGTGLAASSGVLNVIGGNGITANANDMAITAAQTTITSIYNTSLIIGEDSATAIDFGSANEIDFKASGLRLTLTSARLAPETNNEIDLGTSSLKYKDIYAHGTIYSTNFEGNLTGTVTNAAHVTITDNESVDEDNKIPFIEDGEATGNNGLESDGDLHYNPSTGKVTATLFAGTLTTAAQANVTSLGTLTTLTVDNVNINGNTINCTSGDLTVTAAGGDISFGNENISGTGTLGISGVATFTATSVHNGGLSTGALLMNDGSITDTSGSISFNDENLSTTGRITCASLRLTDTGDAEPDDSASQAHAFQIGATDDANVIIDGNEIMARDDGSAAVLHLNADGGTVVINGGLASANHTTFAANGDISCRNLKAEEDVWAFTSSDSSLKDNKKLIQNPLDVISNISGYTFDWNDKAANHLEGHDYGVMADEIESVMPELVTTRENGIKAVRYEGIIPLLIEAIKELKNEINDGICC